MFYTYNQNNSGGYFYKNEFVDEVVIIEGDNAEEIQYKADNIFRDWSRYCSCCGERWEDICEWYELDNEPLIYGKSVYEYKDGYSKEAKAIIYYKDGRKEVVDISEK